MNKITTALICFSLFVSINGCTTLRTGERYEYERLEKRLSAVGLEPERRKDPTLAGALNVLPGVGNAYLNQWGIFVANLLFWPLSVVWGVPQAAIDASTINKQDTLYFYNYADGKQRLAQIEKEKGIQTSAQPASSVTGTR